MTEFDHEKNDAPSLSARQEAFITALLKTPSIVAAAKDAGIGEKTARRWLTLPLVRQAYQDAQREVYASGLNELKSAVSLAVSTLTSCLKNEETPASVRVRAAEIILKQAIEIHSIQELEAKIEALEQSMKEQSDRSIEN